jgi:hypothetical protein
MPLTEDADAFEQEQASASVSWQSYKGCDEDIITYSDDKIIH